MIVSTDAILMYIHFLGFCPALLPDAQLRHVGSLSQNRYSSSIVPFFQWPTVAMGSLKDLPFGGIGPLADGIGFVKVPSITPVTAVHSPSPRRTGCCLIRVSGA